MEIDWSNAYQWAEDANKGKDSENEPRWSWDCGFKLDFDGPILQISSRFYPPHKNSGDYWQGSISIYFLSECIEEREVKKDTLAELKVEVESAVKTYIESVKEKLQIDKSK